MPFFGNLVQNVIVVSSGDILLNYQILTSLDFPFRLHVNFLVITDRTNAKHMC